MSQDCIIKNLGNFLHKVKCKWVVIIGIKIMDVVWQKLGVTSYIHRCEGNSFNKFRLILIVN
jgi:hypothetical protein